MNYQCSHHKVCVARGCVHKKEHLQKKSCADKCSIYEKAKCYAVKTRKHPYNRHVTGRREAVRHKIMIEEVVRYTITWG